ncbi:hypothetical protein OKW48_001769 [Paraburkholderia youngii]
MGGRIGLRGQLVGHVPRQQFVDAIDLLVSDVGEDVFEVGARVNVVQLACPDQAVHCGGPFTHSFAWLIRIIGIIRGDQKRGR